MRNKKNVEFSEQTWPMPETVGLLHALKRGQIINYYRGDFEKDIARSVPVAQDTPRRKRGVKQYRSNLELIRETAKKLARERKISLSFRRTEAGEMVYMARGL